MNVRRASTTTDRLVAKAFSLAFDASRHLSDAAEVLAGYSRGNRTAVLWAAARVRRGLAERSSELGERALSMLTAASTLLDSTPLRSAASERDANEPDPQFAEEPSA
jgi:hypothetical protein